MAEYEGTEDFPIKKIAIDAFFGGINTSAGPTEIEDNEAVEIWNFEYDNLNNIATRNGVTKSGDIYSNRITSIFSFRTDSGFVGILYTSGTSLYSRPLVLGSITNLTGALSLPSNVRWYWAALNGVAVGVNGATGAGNPIQVVGPAPGTASHLAAAPDGRYITEWNNRLFIVSVANPNQIQCSDLGSATSWNTNGFTVANNGVIINVAPGDGDIITGLYSTKERLFIFKKRKIYVLRAPALPNTDPNNWEVVEYSKRIGCIAQSTIRGAVDSDDALFLTEAMTVASLKGAETTADFELNSIGQKIAQIGKIKGNITDADVFAYTFNDKSQYWLCVSGSFSPFGFNTTFVLDYSKVRQGIARWVFFDGYAFGTAIEQYGESADQMTYLIGCDDPNNTDFFIGLYTPNIAIKTFADGTLGIRQFIFTKAYNYNLDDLRKEMVNWFLGILLLSDTLSLSASYVINEGEETAEYTFGLVRETGSGGVYGTGLYGTTLYGEIPEPSTKRIVKAPIWGKLRKFVTVQFRFSCSTVNQGFAINSFGTRAGILSRNKAGNI
jgi:hypothetical protein